MAKPTKPKRQPLLWGRALAWAVFQLAQRAGALLRCPVQCSPVVRFSSPRWESNDGTVGKRAATLSCWPWPMFHLTRCLANAALLPQG